METKKIINLWKENKVELIGYRLENGEIILEFKENK